MDTNPSLEQLTEKLLAELNKKMDQRDIALIERLSKQTDERLAAALAEAAKRNGSAVVPGLDANSPEIKNYSFTRLLRGALEARRSGREEAMQRLAPMEYALHLDALKAKDQAGSTDTGGGYLVPAQVMNAQLIPLLQAELGLAQLGVTMMDGLTGSPVEIPKRTSGTTAYWINHDITSGATQPTSTDAAFGQLRLTPRTIAARCRLSHRLINLSAPAAEQVVRDQIVFDLALAIETAAYAGTGVDGQPRGILNTDGINTSSVGSVAGTGAYDAMQSMIQKLREDFALRGNPKWLMNSAIFAAIQKMKDASDQPKARHLLSEGPLTMLLGYGYHVTDLAPANTLMFANWAEMIVGRWGGLALKVDDLSVLGLLQTQILASMDCDIQVRHPESFCNGTSVTV